MKTKNSYKPPTVEITRVVLEAGFVQAPVSIEVHLRDWEDGGVLGDDPGEGGDIYLIY